MSVSQLEDKERQIIGYVTVVADITERKQAEAALKMQGAAFESFTLALIITDRDGVITCANSAFTSVLGYSHEEAKGMRHLLPATGQKVLLRSSNTGRI